MSTALQTNIATSNNAAQCNCASAGGTAGRALPDVLLRVDSLGCENVVAAEIKTTVSAKRSCCAKEKKKESERARREEGGYLSKQKY